jgi:hypothetical protein
LNTIPGCDLSKPTFETERAPPKSARNHEPTRRPFRLSRSHAQLLETLVSVGCPMTPLAVALVIGLGTMI